jgi:hypothetical protein
MSDIWIKTTNTGTTKWRKATNIYIKRLNSGTIKWFAAKAIWIKNTSAAWLRVWPLSGVYPITDPYITTTASGTTALDSGNVIRIGTEYFGRNGTWDPNGFTISSYTYTWPYYSEAESQPGDFDLLGNLGTGTYSAPSRALTISSAANATAVDGKYISFRIRANASNDTYSNTADSKDTYGKIKVIRRTPINISFAINGTTTVGSVLSVASSWNITEARKPNASRTTIKWYRSDSATAIYSGGGRTEITSASGLYQYTLVEADKDKYIVAEETTFNTGSDYDIGVDLFTNGQNQVTAVTAKITSAYSFAFGNTLYVGSNGYIGLDNGGFLASSPGSGRNVNIYNTDLVQYRLQEYSDNDNYHLYFRSYRYQSPLVRSAINALDYQIKFYKDQPYCDVTLIRKGSSVPIQSNSPGYYGSGLSNFAGLPGPFVWAAGSVLRVYFNGTAATLSGISWTAIPDNVWKDITNADIDDSFTSVVTSVNQSAPVPVTPTSLTATTNDSAKITLTWSGGSADTYLLYWLTGGTSSWPDQTFTGFDFTDTGSPYEWGNGTTTNPTRGVTYYFFIRGRNGTSPDFVYSANWFPAQTTGIIGRAPLYAPPTPNTPTSSGITTTNITVSWTAGTVGTGQDAGTSFEVYTSTTNSTPSTSTSGTAKTSPASYTYTASASPSTQYFWVRALNADANSAWSSVLSATPTALNPPGVVSNVASTSISSTSIAWSWSAPTSGGTPTGYEYAISTTTTEPSTFTNLGSTTRAVTTSSLTANTDYYLFVKAKNNDGTSASVRNTTAVKTSASGATVTFKANGGTGSDYTQTASTSTALTSNTFTRSDTFVTPTFTGTLPGWTSANNFQRTTGTGAFIRYGWNNGTQTWSGTINDYVFAGWNTAANGTGTSYANQASYAFTSDLTLFAQWTTSRRGRGFNWQLRSSTSTSSSTNITDSGFKNFTTTQDTRATVQGTNFIYLLRSDGSSAQRDIIYSASARNGRVQVYQFGTDGNEYNSGWTGFI